MFFALHAALVVSATISQRAGGTPQAGLPRKKGLDSGLYSRVYTTKRGGRRCTLAGLQGRPD